MHNKHHKHSHKSQEHKDHMHLKIQSASQIIYIGKFDYKKT